MLVKTGNMKKRYDSANQSACSVILTVYVRSEMNKTNSYYSPHNWLCPNPALLISVHFPTKVQNSISVLFPKVGLIHHPKKANYYTINCFHKLILKFSTVREERAVTSSTT